MAFEFEQAQEFSQPEQIAMLSRAFRKKGKPVVLVPLGKGIHAGHCALLRAARRTPGAVVVAAIESGVEARDVLLAERVDAVWTYSFEQLWPKGQRTLIGARDSQMEDPELLAEELTRLITLINVVGPSDVVVGEKDYELLVNVQHVVTDLHIPVAVHSVPTVRTQEGLAMSLRNVEVAESERDKAAALSAALTAGAFAAENGAEEVLKVTREVLEAAGVTPCYLEVRGLDLGPAPTLGDARLFLAADISGVHLADNVGLPLGVGFKNVEAVEA